MEPDRKLNIKIWIVIAALVFGAIQIQGTKNDIKDQLDLDAVIAQHNNGINLLSGNLDNSITYIDRETFAKVNLLQIKLTTEITMFFVGIVILLQLFDSSGFKLMDSIKRLRE